MELITSYTPPPQRRRRALAALCRWTLSSWFVMFCAVSTTASLYGVIFGGSHVCAAAFLGYTFGVTWWGFAPPTHKLLRGAYAIDQPIERNYLPTREARYPALDVLLYLGLLLLIAVAVGPLAEAVEPYTDGGVAMMPLGCIACMPGVLLWPYRHLADWAYTVLDEADFARSAAGAGEVSKHTGTTSDHR